jgi:hypothetical protein
MPERCARSVHSSRALPETATMGTLYAPNAPDSSSSRIRRVAPRPSSTGLRVLCELAARHTERRREDIHLEVHQDQFESALARALRWRGKRAEQIDALLPVLARRRLAIEDCEQLHENAGGASQRR